MHDSYFIECCMLCSFGKFKIVCTRGTSVKLVLATENGNGICVGLQNKFDFVE